MFNPIRWLARYLRDRRGSISPLFVLALVPIIGAMGVALEGSNWWLTQRSVQNAADTAAMAADWNGGTTCSGTCSATSYTSGCGSNPGDFDCEAVGAAAQTGFVNGSKNVTVYPQHLTNLTTPACPGSLTSCWEVTVTKQVPIYMVDLLGYMGTGGGKQNVRATAIAGLETQPNADCMLGLGTSGDDLTTKGAPSANLAGCDIALSAGGSCNSSHSSLGSPESFYPSGFSDDCSTLQAEEAPPADPYAKLATNIPTTCPGTIITTLSGAETLGSTVCANNTDLKLTANTTINSNTTIIIYNGNLNLNGFSLTSGCSSGCAGANPVGYGLTIIFTGSSTSAGHSFTNFGTVNIAAPTSGTWSGMAIYQDPNTNPTDKNGANDIALAGNDTFQISGVIYQPNASDTFKGAIDKATNGFSCFVWVYNSLQINGTADIFGGGEPGVQAQCGPNQAGVTQIFSQTFIHSLVG